MKKTWLKRTLLGVAVSTALLGSVAAYSEGTGFHRGPPTPEQIAQHEQHLLDHVGKKLNLDANQAAKLKALADLAIADHAPPASAAWPACSVLASTCSLAAWLASRFSVLPMWASMAAWCWAMSSADGGPWWKPPPSAE